MITEPAAMMETVAGITGVARPDIDIVREKLDQIMGKDEIARLEEEGRRLDVVIQNIKGRDTRAMRWNIALKEYEKRMRDAGRAEAFIRWQLAKYRTAAALGAEPGYIPALEPVGTYTDFPEIGPEGVILPQSPSRTSKQKILQYHDYRESVNPLSIGFQERAFFEWLKHQVEEEKAGAFKEPLQQPEPVELPPLVPPAAPESAEPSGLEQTGPVTMNYIFDHSLRYYPRVGSDESGPRVAPGVVV